VLGLGHAVRHRLEEILAEFVLTLSEVQARLRGVTLPLRDPQLCAVVDLVLRKLVANERQEIQA
jgi:hypothetical protein